MKFLILLFALTIDNTAPIQGSGHEPATLVSVDNVAHAYVGSSQISGDTRVVTATFNALLGGKHHKAFDATPDSGPKTEVELTWTSGGKLVKVKLVRGKNEKDNEWRRRVKSETATMEDLFPPDPIS